MSQSTAQITLPLKSPTIAMKALTLHQPFATLVMMREKKIETRSWYTPYRGRLAIHAAATFPTYAKALLGREPFLSVLEAYCSDMENDQSQFPLGKIIATCDLVDCLSMKNKRSKYAHGRSYPKPGSNEHAFGLYAPDRFMWILDNIEPLAVPIPARGLQRLWNWHAPAGVSA